MVHLISECIHLILSTNNSSDGSSVGSLTFVSQASTTQKMAAYIQCTTVGSSGTYVGGDLNFATASNTASSPTAKMSITSVGNVGIGVLNPTASVEMNATSSKPIISGQATDGSLTLQRMNGTRVAPTAIITNNYLGVLGYKGQYDSTVGHVIQGAGIAAIASGNWSSTTVHPTLLSFTVSPSSGAEFEAMRLHPDGNLSIGNSTSSEKLSITGNIKVTGGVYLGVNSAFVGTNAALALTNLMYIDPAGNVFPGTG
jgi:uncharacterized membrane protein